MLSSKTNDLHKNLLMQMTNSQEKEGPKSSTMRVKNISKFLFASKIWTTCFGFLFPNIVFNQLHLQKLRNYFWLSFKSFHFLQKQEKKFFLGVWFVKYFCKFDDFYDWNLRQIFWSKQDYVKHETTNKIKGWRENK